MNIATSLCALTLLTVSTLAQGLPIRATVLRADGRSLVREPGQAIERAHSGQKLQPGSLFRTGSSAELDMGLVPGSFTRAKGGTIGRLYRVEFEKKNNTITNRRVEIDIQEGLFLSVIREDTPKYDFRVATPQMVAAAKGTVFSVFTNAALKLTRVAVAKGTVIVALANGKRILVNEGFFIVVQGEGRGVKLVERNYVSANGDARGDVRAALVFFSSTVGSGILYGGWERVGDPFTNANPANLIGEFVSPPVP